MPGGGSQQIFASNRPADTRQPKAAKRGYNNICMYHNLIIPQPTILKSCLENIRGQLIPVPLSSMITFMTRFCIISTYVRSTPGMKNGRSGAGTKQARSWHP